MANKSDRQVWEFVLCLRNGTFEKKEAVFLGNENAAFFTWEKEALFPEHFGDTEVVGIYHRWLRVATDDDILNEGNRIAKEIIRDAFGLDDYALADLKGALLMQDTINRFATYIESFGDDDLTWNGNVLIWTGELEAELLVWASEEFGEDNSED